MKLSIIIPVYNAEKYLQKCLESIVCQNLHLHDFEVVLINDGSTDGSLQIAESFINKISNYTVVTHKNQGEAASRNKALDIANGEYITFLDADDYYEERALETALKIISQNNLDILYLRLRQVDEEGNSLGFVYDMQKEGEVLGGINYERRPFPATIYRRKIIGNVSFPQGIIVGPDSVFNALVQSKAERVTFTSYAIYNYTYRTNSLSKQGHSQYAFEGFIKAIVEIRAFQFEHFPNDEKANIYFNKMFAVFVTRILELNVIPQWNYSNYKQLLKTLENENLRYILDTFESKYPYVSKSFHKFKLYQQYLALKSKVYKIVYRA